jgi:hypothetical protein
VKGVKECWKMAYEGQGKGETRGLDGAVPQVPDMGQPHTMQGARKLARKEDTGVHLCCWILDGLCMREA